MGGPCSFHSPLLRYGPKSRRTVAQAVTERRGASFSAVPGRAGDMRDWVGTVALPSRGCLAVPCIGTCLQAATCGTDSLDKNGTAAWTDPSRFTLCDQDGTDRREEILAGTDTEGHAFPTPGSPLSCLFFFVFSVHFGKWKERALPPAATDLSSLLEEEEKNFPFGFARRANDRHHNLNPQPSNRSGRYG